MPNLSDADLDRHYFESEQCDADIFSEQRANILLVAGEHYTRRGSRFWQRIRDSKKLTEKEKLRLTRNHIQNITRSIVGHILSKAPNTRVVPNNEGETQDQKSAELNESVSKYLKKNMKIRDKVRDAAEDFVNLGEVFSFHLYDPHIGEVKGYRPLMDELGEPVVDPQTGQMQPDKEQPIMTGGLVRKRMLAFNVLRDPQVENLHDSPYLIFREMTHKREIKKFVKEDEWEQVEKYLDSGEETYLVFEGDRAKYTTRKDMVCLRYHFFRPSLEYPEGYLFIAIRGKKLWEGELPFGIWPICYKQYDKIATSARARSPIKHMKPYQLEINRCASAIATTQISLGDDKILLPNNAKLTQGGVLPGVRVLNISGGGGTPITMGGRSGEQYLEWMRQSINELYDIIGVEEKEYTRDGKFDPYAMLYFSMRNKRKFAKYVEAFEEFVIEEEELRLNLAKHYFDEDLVIPMIGRDEAVNISEFKNQEPNRYRIKVEAISEDAETMMGKVLGMNHTLQYVGQQLTREDIGRMMRAHPYMNMEESFDDFTIDYDNAKNDILALERGEVPLPNLYGQHVYTINRLVHRMKKADYPRLPEDIRKNFEEYKMQLQKIEAEQQRQMKAMQDDLIPVTGMLITLNNFRVADPETGEPMTVRLPYDAVVWLIQKLDDQKMSLKRIENMNQQALIQLGQQAMSPQQLPQAQGGVLQ